MSESNEVHNPLITEFNNFFPVLTNPETINNLVDGEKLTLTDLEKITVPTGGGIIWNVERSSNQEAVKELRGIILSQILTRSLYARTYEESGGRDPAICFSSDSIVGYINSEALPEGQFPKKFTKIGNPNGQCKNCPFSQWGSKLKANGSFGRGQMCQQRRFLLLLTPKKSMPVLVSIPAGGLKNAKRYLINLQSVGLRHWQVVTNLQLTPDKNDDGIKFSRPTFTLDGIVPQDNWERISNYVKEFKAWLMGE